MKKKSKEIINTLEEPSSEWVGHRPTLPDSLPVLGPSLQNPNIYYNFGHQHLGLTLAALSGKIIRDMVIKAHVNYNVSAFSPQRFT
jgi:D-amino-acid dehydrogenase